MSKIDAIEALKRILKKSPQKVGRSEAADMAIEFQLEARVALEALIDVVSQALTTPEKVQAPMVGSSPPTVNHDKPCVTCGNPTPHIFCAQAQQVCRCSLTVVPGESKNCPHGMSISAQSSKESNK